VREFCRMLVGSGKKWFDFALLAAGYDTGGKSPRTVRRLSRKLGCQLLVDGLSAPRQSCRFFKQPLKRDRRFPALWATNRFSKKSLP
jgi:hypothetical protein